MRLRRVVEGWYVRFIDEAYEECEKSVITTGNARLCQRLRRQTSTKGGAIFAVDNFPQTR